MDAAGELPQVRHDSLRLGVRLAHEVGGAVGIRADRQLRHPEGHGEADQTWLHTVVEIPLDAQPLLGGCIDRALATLGELGDLFAQIILGAGDEDPGQSAIRERPEHQGEHGEQHEAHGDDAQHPAGEVDRSDLQRAVAQRDITGAPSQPQQGHEEEEEQARHEHRDVVVQHAAPEGTGSELEPPIVEPPSDAGAPRATPGRQDHGDPVHGDGATPLDPDRTLHDQEPGDDQQQPGPEGGQGAET